MHADHFNEEDINYWLKLLATSCVLHAICFMTCHTEINLVPKINCRKRVSSWVAAS